MYVAAPKWKCGIVLDLILCCYLPSDVSNGQCRNGACIKRSQQHYLSKYSYIMMGNVHWTVWGCVASCVHFCCGWYTICHSDDSALCTACTDCPKKDLHMYWCHEWKRKDIQRLMRTRKRGDPRTWTKMQEKPWSCCACVLVIQTSIWSQWKTGSHKKLELVCVSGKVTLVPSFARKRRDKREKEVPRENQPTCQFTKANQSML